MDEGSPPKRNDYKHSGGKQAAMLHPGLLTGGETLNCSRKRFMQGAILTNLVTAQKNMASSEKVDARGLILVSKFLLRLLNKLDDEMVQLVTQDQQQRN